jgi:hypothetical protein
MVKIIETAKIHNYSYSYNLAIYFCVYFSNNANSCYVKFLDITSKFHITLLINVNI